MDILLLLGRVSCVQLKQQLKTSPLIMVGRPATFRPPLGYAPTTERTQGERLARKWIRDETRQAKWKETSIFSSSLPGAPLNRSLRQKCTKVPVLGATNWEFSLREAVVPAAAQMRPREKWAPRRSPRRAVVATNGFHAEPEKHHTRADGHLPYVRGRHSCKTRALTVETTPTSVVLSADRNLERALL